MIVISTTSLPCHHCRQSWHHDNPRLMMTSSNGNIFRVTGHLCGESPVNSPHKGQWRGALMFSLICAWTKGWVNNGEAGDLRRYRAHYDVTVMCQWIYAKFRRPLEMWGIHLPGVSDITLLLISSMFALLVDNHPSIEYADKEDSSSDSKQCRHISGLGDSLVNCC